MLLQSQSFDLVDGCALRPCIKVYSVKRLTGAHSICYGLPANDQRTFFRAMLRTEIFHGTKK